jgi:Ni,Fe-hydrogenase III large subunit
MSESPDPRMRNGWAEYQRLVLAELERLNDQMTELSKSQRDTDIKIALLKEENGKIKELALGLVEIIKRITVLENSAGVETAIKKYRGAIVAAGILLISSVLIPLIALFIGGGG